MSSPTLFFAKKKREWYVCRPTLRNTKKAPFVGSTETEKKVLIHQKSGHIMHIK